MNRDVGWRLEATLLSDMGRVRTNNEDAVSESLEHGLLVLADGMGGYNAGEVASSIAVDIIPEVIRREWKHLARIKERPDGPSAETLLLKEAIEESHDRIYKMAQSEQQCAGMGTTVVAVILRDGGLHVAHVGDSRLYLHRNGVLEQVTVDHSLQEEMIARGHYTREEAMVMVRKNIVTRALGVEPKVEVELGEYEATGGDILLLCSDGLTDMVADPIISDCLERHKDSLNDAATELRDLALEGGGRDNVSVIIARVAAPGTALSGDGNVPDKDDTTEPGVVPSNVTQGGAAKRPWYRRMLDWFKS